MDKETMVDLCTIALMSDAQLGVVKRATDLAYRDGYLAGARARAWKDALSVLVLGVGFWVGVICV